MTELPVIKAFIQARMSSSRFPGKVLAPLHGKPIIAHVIERVMNAMPKEHIVVATSDHPSDNPLAYYVGAELGITVFRGALTNVFERLRACLAAHPGDWFFRVSGDSPLLDASLFGRMRPYAAAQDVSVVTNVWPRTFPKGQSLEMIHAPTFRAVDPARLTADEAEHVTKIFYQNPDEFRIINIANDHPVPPEPGLAVDTIDDFHRIEKLLESESATL